MQTKESNQQEGQAMSSHWSKLDHVAFLLMLPYILILLIYPFIFYNPFEHYYSMRFFFFVIAFSSFCLLCLWLMAFCYDLAEEKYEKNKEEAKPT
jgi:hypothetical protein